jgi:hypothetical protein
VSCNIPREAEASILTCSIFSASGASGPLFGSGGGAELSILNQGIVDLLAECIDGVEDDDLETSALPVGRRLALSVTPRL